MKRRKIVSAALMVVQVQEVGEQAKKLARDWMERWRDGRGEEKRENASVTALDS